MAAARFGAGWLFGEQQPLAGDPFLQIGMLRRIGDIDPARDDADRVRQRALMRRTIDSARQARNHREARFRERRGEVARQLDRRCAGIARADHGYTGPCRQCHIAAQRQDRRRPRRLREQCGIAGLVVEQVPCPGCTHRFDFTLDRVRRSGAIAAPAAFPEIGQSLQRCGGRPEALQQQGIADGPDIGRTQQPDAGESLVLRKGRGRRAGHPPAPSLLPPTRGSSPFASRAILARCR